MGSNTVLLLTNCEIIPFERRPLTNVARRLVLPFYLINERINDHVTYELSNDLRNLIRLLVNEGFALRRAMEGLRNSRIIPNGGQRRYLTL